MSKGCRVRTTRTEVSHLQFPDDSLFLGEWSSWNASNLMMLLDNFGKTFGLSINLQKSCLLGIGVSLIEIKRLAARIHCASSSLPFLYLGLLVGANMKRVVSCRVLEEKVNRKLSKWKQKSLSIGGRLMLIRSVLNSTPSTPPCFGPLRQLFKGWKFFARNFFGAAPGRPRKLYGQKVRDFIVFCLTAG